MRGQGGFFLIFLFSLTISLLQSCSKEVPEEMMVGECFLPPTAEEEPNSQVRFLEANEGFSFSCQEALRVISYVERVHLAGEGIATVPLLQQGFRGIIASGRFSTPFFRVNTDKSSHRDYIENHIAFHLFPNQEEKLEGEISGLEKKEDLCSTAVTVVSELGTGLSKGSQDMKPYLLPLLLKSLVRNFVGSLDPHSRFYENLEYHYLITKREEEAKVVNTVAPLDKAYEGDGIVVQQLVHDEKAILAMELLEFKADTAEKFKEVYLGYYNRQEKITDLVIDLRRNQGGDAFVVADLLDLFLKKGLIHYMRERTMNGWQPYLHYATPGNELPGISDVDITILMSRVSASSAETFASAMQDYKRAVIVGERSFGKGTGQRNEFLRKLPVESKSCSILKLTQLEVFSPKGTPLQKRGVIPDVSFPKREEPQSYTLESAYPNALVAPSPIQTDFEEANALGNERWQKLKLEASSLIEEVSF